MPHAMPAPGKSVGLVTMFKQDDFTYEQKYVDCGKVNCSKCNRASGRYPSHGPYWYMCFASNHKWYRIYMGKHCDTTRFKNADGSVDWQQVRERGRKKLDRKNDKKKPPDQVDVADGAAADSGAPRARGPAHVAALEDSLERSRKPA